MRTLIRFLLATALALTANSTHPLAQAGGQAAGAKGGPDIAGFRAGMPLQEAYAMLKAYKPKAKFIVEETMVPELSDKKLPYALYLTESGVGQFGETLQLNITLPPSPQVIWMVQRWIGFQPGTEVAKTNLVAGLREKYGPETTQTGIGALFWIFEGGRRLAQEGLKHCSGGPPGEYGPMRVNPSGSVSMAWPIPDRKPPIMEVPPGFKPCAPFTYVFVAPSQGGAGQGIQWLESWLVDLPLITGTHKATYEQIMKVRSGQEQKKIDDTKQRPIPKL